MATLEKQDKFFLSRNKASHYGDRIEFAAHHERSLTIEDATALRDRLTELLDEPKPSPATDWSSPAEDKTAETSEKPRKSWGKR